MKNKALWLFAVLMTALPIMAKDITLASPDGQLKMTVQLGADIKYAVEYKGVQVLTPSAISMTLTDGKVLGANPKLTKTTRQSANEQLTTVAYRKHTVNNHFNGMTLTFKGGYSVEFKAFDNGCGYRFKLAQGKNKVIVENEQSEYNFAADHDAIYAYANKTGDVTNQFACSFENWYNETKLSKIDSNKIMFLPVMVELPQGMKVVITEANMFDYPGMFLQNFKQESSLKAIYAPYPKETHQGGHNNLQRIVDSRENYIAKIDGTRDMPWRLIALSTADKDMTDNDLVYCVADPCKLDDTSWIKPGKVAWDWWNDWNLEGVDFKAGINNATYKYYIDFASKYGIEYVILDEGWAVNKKADMMLVVPEINLEELVAYGKSKHVGIVLWGGFQAMDKDMEGVCKHYAEMGVVGFKVDFMDRDDQLAVDFYNRMTRTAAKYKLMIDFHGAFKPSGLNRTYPNVINYEGVAGLEQMKWSTDKDQVTYDVTLPFIRQVAGPMDYTQGAMRNANKNNYRAVNTEPMSQGTRCHQLAEYIIFESPFNMLCDAPTNYEKEPAYTQFLAQIPTIWDETRTLDGKVRQYVLTARRKGNNWYIGGLNNWDARTLTVDLSAIGDVNAYTFEIYQDGVNADRKATDYKHTTLTTAANGKVDVLMQPGGGFVIKAVKK